MLKPTRPHKDYLNGDKKKSTLRVGNNVPEGAINLAYYYNKGSNVLNKSILSMAAPRNSIDHIEIVDYKNATNLKEKDENIFDVSMEYKDEDGYVGVLYRVSVEWFEKDKTDSKFCMVQKEYKDLKEKKVPSSIEHQEGVMNGTLLLTKETYTPTDFEEITISNTYKKLKTRVVSKVGLSSPSYNFQDEIDEVDGEYKGKLKLDKSSIEFVEVNNDSSVKSVEIVKEFVGINPTIPSTIDYEYGGVIHKIPLTNTLSTTTDVKHYGITRYWGYSRTGLYGTGDRKYMATKYGGKGYFGTDPYPAQVASRYGHFPTDILAEHKNVHVKSPYTKWKEISSSGTKVVYFDETITKVNGKPYSLNGYSSYHNYDTVVNRSGVTKDLFEGTEWIYDLDKSASYGAPNNLNHGGCVWGSQYLAHTDVWPPKGYENDPIWKGDQHMILVTDNFLVRDNKKYYPNDYLKVEGKMYKASDIIKYNNYGTNKATYNDHVLKRNCFFTNVTRSTPALAYPGNQQYSRMVLSFYKGKTRKTRVVYSANIIIDKGKSYTARATYNGELSKTIQSSETVPIKWDCVAVYQGDINYYFNLYDALATYRGIAVKRNAVGNLSPNTLNEVKMYPNDEGYLMTNLDDDKSVVVDGRNFMITDVYSGKTPLYYSYLLSDYIYDLDGPNRSGIYEGNSIKLVDSHNNELKEPYMYKIKLISTSHDNMYRAIVFTSFETSYSNKIYCVYNSCASNGQVIDMDTFESGKRELIFVQPAYQMNRDYEIIETDEYRESKIKVYDYTKFKDARKKIPITYIVRTNDGKYVSDPIHANVINKQFAIESEYKDFEGEGYIISPKYDEVFLNAKDILIRDRGLVGWELDNKQIVVEFFNDNNTMQNNSKVYIYTNQDGSGNVIAETSEETGFLNPETNNYDLTYRFDAMFKLHNNFITSAFSVINKDIKSIELDGIDQTHNISSWYAKIRFGSFSQTLEQYNNKTKITYSIPEFSNQYFNSSDGEPYKHIEDEEVEIIDTYTIKLSKTPLYVKHDSDRKLLNLHIYKKNIFNQNLPVTIKSWSYKEGIIEVKEAINDTDKLYASYEYEEEGYVYRGYYRGNDFIDLNLNPSIYYDYLDTTEKPFKRLKTLELLNKVIYFFIRPKRIEDVEMGEVFVENDEVLYHKFNDSTPSGEHDLLIGKMITRHNTSLKSTVLVDTRQFGGGVNDKISDKLRKELEPESDYYFDIGCYDGNMYFENATVIIRLSNKLLKENGGDFNKDYIKNVVDKWKSFGVNAFIEYVDCNEPYTDGIEADVVLNN